MHSESTAYLCVLESFITYRQQGHDDLQSAGKRNMQSRAQSSAPLEDPVERNSGEGWPKRVKGRYRRRASCPRNPIPHS